MTEVWLTTMQAPESNHSGRSVWQREAAVGWFFAGKLSMLDSRPC